MIEVIESTALVTVQDLGRTGSFRYGVPQSGAMDALALATGNSMLGNAADAAGIEIPMSRLVLRFGEDCAFAITGAPCQAWLDDEEMLPWSARSAWAGQTLTLVPSDRQVFTYVTIAGGIDVPPVLGSRSTQHRGSFGGLFGRALRAGDRLPLSPTRPIFTCDFAVPPPPFDTDMPLRVVPAAEYDLLTPRSRENLWAKGWKVTGASNRAGYRLSGETLLLTETVELRSHGIVPGVLQLPPSGQPVVQLADAATMGGYPKIGTVIPADLWRLAQHRPRESLRFQMTDYRRALAAMGEHEAFLEKIASIGAARRKPSHARPLVALIDQIADIMRRNRVDEIVLQEPSIRLTLKASTRNLEASVSSPEAGRWHRCAQTGIRRGRHAVVGWLETETGLLPVRSDLAPFGMRPTNIMVGAGDVLFSTRAEIPSSTP
ncbi:biotin-dependent carboxylase uncharacterized domain-containing protein [Faunimonas pinastri]|uniref:Biotin-dependent carboxylase uncharacterized domain-containing protein n=1 Tax=Faunimonas pinastri TaxID=1855383 RepID=A0A1H9E3Q8_9HYPH|nr:biotin-dependent carboxyltransferase family protein [Faunimonas pinastri]SEQ19558.1 biotin-dependent carboxylase uncharacterized domain-containing protein [Faunimonas pinastri]